MGGDNRPDGSGMIAWGWVLIVLGGLALFIGMVVPTFSDPGYGGYLGGRTPTLNPWKWPLIWLGIGLSNLGVLVLLVGHVIRAIWFLPGRADETAGAVLVDKVAASPTTGAAVISEDASDGEGTSVGTLTWVVVAIMVLGVVAAIILIGGKGSRSSVPANFASEEVNVLDPVLDAGDQTNSTEDRQ